MEQVAWRNVNFLYPRAVPTMISEDEKRYLYWLGQSIWQGEGLVLEIGPWLGGSTICLAAGMLQSGHHSSEMLHTYDNFIWRDFMSIRAPFTLAAGDSFLSHFLENIQPYQNVVVAHRRALPDEVIVGDVTAAQKRFMTDEAVSIFYDTSNQPIEILFVDGAKSWCGMRHLLITLQDRLMPQSSYIVCQDFKYWETYWVPIMMARLEPFVKPVHNVLKGSTVAFKLTSQIPPACVAELPPHMAELPVNQCLQDIDKTSQFLALDGDTLGSMNLLLSKISFLSHQGHIEHAAVEFNKIQKSWPLMVRTMQLERARTYLRDEKALAIAQPKRFTLMRYYKKAKGIARRYFWGAPRG